MNQRALGRSLHQIIGFLLVGLTTAVLAAWIAAAVPVEIMNVAEDCVALSSGDWRISRVNGPGYYRGFAWSCSCDAPRMYSDDPGQWGDLSRAHPGMAIIRDARGWPLRSLRCHWQADRRPRADTHLEQDFVLSGGLRGRSRANDFMGTAHWRLTALPLLPIAPALAGDSLFWGLAWWASYLLLLRVIAIPRWVRRRRNCCPWCGYSRRGAANSTCSECGRDTQTAIVTETPSSRTVVAGMLVIQFSAILIIALLFRSRQGALEPINVAAMTENTAAILEELGRGVDVNLRFDDPSGTATGMTPLMWAARAGACAALAVLIEHGADVDAQTIPGKSALSFAIDSGNIDTLRFLLAAGADPGSASPYGLSLLNYAARSRVAEMFEVLAGLDVDYALSDTSGYAPLLWAAISGDIETIEFLLESGHEINEREPHLGLTPLMGAAMFNDPAIVEALLRAGGDISQKDSRGFTALNIALNLAQLNGGSRTTDIIAILEAAGAGQVEDGGD